MRVLMTSDAAGGVWGYTVELARALAAQGVSTSVAAMGGRLTDALRGELAGVPDCRLFETDRKLPWMTNAWGDVARASDWLLELEARVSPDVVHVNHDVYGGLAWKAPVVCVAHSCVMSWWRAVKGEEAPPDWERYRREVGRGLRGADLVAAPSEWMLSRLRDLYGRLPESRVIANARSSALFAPAPRKDCFVLGAGRLWDDGKNFTTLASAARGMSWPVYAAGEERSNGHRPGRLDGLRLLGRLEFDELRGWYSRAAVFAHPARYEPFGLAPLEAALSGCALVLGDIESLREVWGDAAVFVDPNDPAALGAALDGLMSDEPRRSAMAARARARALRFSPERMADSYRDAYDRARELRAKRLAAARPAAVAAAAPKKRTPAVAPALAAAAHRPARPRVVLFAHSLLSDWNHGNAHFLRGIASELAARGHSVVAYEPEDAWSLTNLLAENGSEPLERLTRVYPSLRVLRYDLARLDLDEALDGAGIVLVHEWNDPELVRRLGRHRQRTRAYRLFFHDTHHRAVTDPEAMARFDLAGYDGTLAFGSALADVYLRRGWTERVWVWHEAADTRVFRPRLDGPPEGDLVWIGNWGDEERAAELREFLLEPSQRLGLRTRAHGVRYPDEALAALRSAGVEHAGWVPNFEVPEIFGRFRATVHVPRRPYARALPGIPTIRPFEALACGIPLVISRFEDVEGLFRPGRDFLVAKNGAGMRRALRAILSDPSLAAELVANGLRTVRERHSCAHRVAELLDIAGQLEEAAGASALA